MKRLETQTPRRDSHRTLIIVVALLVLVNVLSVRHQSVTYDEPDHFIYGLMIAHGDSTRFDDSKMPVSFLSVLPSLIVNSSTASPQPTVGDHPGYQIASGRMVTILFSILVALIIYRWTRDLYGSKPALFATFLYTCEPNIIAHSQLVTTDVFALGVVTLSTYTFWLFLQSPSWKRAIVSSTALGASQLVKYTCIYLYPIFLTIVVIRHFRPIVDHIRKRELQQLTRKFLNPFLKFACLFAIVTVIVVNAGFLFNRTGTPLNRYEFKSELFQSLQKALAPFGGIPVPFPYPFVQGLDLVKYRERTGEGYGNIYLLGKLHETDGLFKGDTDGRFTGFPGYYLYAFLFKVPIALQIILVLSVLRYARSWSMQRFLDHEIFLLMPVLFFTFYFNFFYKAQIGIRHFLVVFPFLIIFCGNLVRFWDTFTMKHKAAVVALSAYLVLSVLSYYPHYIPYFNELVVDRKTAYKILADSNIDWGQSEWYLARYVRDHPDSIVNPVTLRPGRIIVNVNRLVGINAGPDQYHWLRENFKPTDHVAYAYLVYDVTSEDLKKISGKTN